MKAALNKLSREQIEFICSECSITEDELFSMDDEMLYDEIYEKMCNIEIDEVCAHDGDDETERCSIASDIVTILGNAIAEEDGYFEQEKDAV